MTHVSRHTIQLNLNQSFHLPTLFGLTSGLPQPLRTLHDISDQSIHLGKLEDNVALIRCHVLQILQIFNSLLTLHQY